MNVGVHAILTDKILVEVALSDVLSIGYILLEVALSNVLCICFCCKHSKLAMELFIFCLKVLNFL
jgi:hypothetical protein